jgi:subtilisin family serine protease
MTANIQEQLRATGIAQVIVVLKAALAPAATAGLSLTKSVPSPLPKSAAAGLDKYFTASKLSQDSELAQALTRKARREKAAQKGTTRVGLKVMASATGRVSAPKVRYFDHLGLLFGTVDRAGFKRLRADRRVHSVSGALEISLIRPVMVKSATATEPVTWGLDRLGIPDLWDKGFTGKGVLVGHLDTGVDGKHPALKTAIGAFAEFDLMGRPVPNSEPHDTDQHGTHTAGTIAGRKVGVTAFGVAPDALLASAIVIEGGNVVARILAGMDWVVGQGARVLSMSLGLRGYREDFLPVVQVLRARNVLPVFAVGNEGPGTSRSPGNYVEALSVGACDEDDHVASFSSSQRFRRRDNPLVPDLVAPGVNVVSSVPGGGYAQMSGTSMATPHIAGLAALLFQAKPTATADEVEAAIFASCERPNGMAEERGNRGIPNGPKALASLTGTAAPATATGTAKTPKKQRAGSGR